MALFFSPHVRANCFTLRLGVQIFVPKIRLLKEYVWRRERRRKIDMVENQFLQLE
jgi:hypothetical protein